jgi:hypothetical protein
MQIQEIYKKYELPPNLQQHMLRVAALAELIYQDFTDSKLINKKTVITACLLHDLGNIIKFDFDNFPELLGAELKNLEHWRQVKAKLIQEYGPDEDVATIKMVKELGVSTEVLFLVENWGFKNFSRIAQSNNWNWKLAVYCDHRISPQGLVTLEENLANKQKRYRLSRPQASHNSDQAIDLFASALAIESELAQMTSRDLQDIKLPELDASAQKLLATEVLKY